VHAEFGEACFEEAVKCALLAVARVAHAEAERRVALVAATHGPNVVVMRRRPRDDPID
jgi:hypothetical protein